MCLFNYSMNKALEVLDPVFAYERDWPVARSGLLKLNRLLRMVKELVKDDAGNSTYDFFSVMDRLIGTVQDFSSDPTNNENVTQILDLTFTIVQDGMKLTKKLLDCHQNQFELQVFSFQTDNSVICVIARHFIIRFPHFRAATVFEGLRNFFSDNLVNSIQYRTSCR